MSNQNGNIVLIEEYQKNWPELFQREAQNIYNILFLNDQTLSPDFFEIHHIGSTSIPGMAAKPIIDILLECDNLQDIDFIKSRLNKISYNEFFRCIIPHYSFFSRKQDDNMVYHLQIRERGDPQIMIILLEKMISFSPSIKKQRYGKGAENTFCHKIRT
jgi:GrpB-like predicted nucleotidyltransferase (UPF0157 family)